MDGLRGGIIKRVKELTGGGCKSTNDWKAALKLAESCRAKFEEPVACVVDIEKKGNEALELLAKR